MLTNKQRIEICEQGSKAGLLVKQVLPRLFTTRYLLQHNDTTIVISQLGDCICYDGSFVNEATDRKGYLSDTVNKAMLSIKTSLGANDNG